MAGTDIDLYRVLGTRDGSTYVLSAVRYEGTSGNPRNDLAFTLSEAREVATLLNQVEDGAHWAPGDKPFT